MSIRSCLMIVAAVVLSGAARGAAPALRDDVALRGDVALNDPVALSDDAAPREDVTLRNGETSRKGATPRDGTTPRNGVTSRGAPALCGGLALASGSSLSESPAPIETPARSVPAPTSKGPAGSWTQHYTLGPGDVLDFSLFGRPDLTRVDLFVEPDGNISYLQATGIHAEGLTVDELRAKLESALSVYYKLPRVMIAPKELHSKKYFILGKVEAAGAYAMDHPVTLVEAVAQAKGVELGLVEDKTVELCDYAHSFILRNGRHLPVDFQKLFVNGDTSQNVVLEPNDYIYMASAISNNIFILGDVRNPGSQGYNANLSVTGAIALRGGFTDTAYRDRVLVLRGSIEHPQHFVVNINRTLHGQQCDFHLEPRDVIFVNSRPWQFAEELLDTAISAFTTAATTTWTSYSVPVLISHPIFPALNSQ